MQLKERGGIVKEDRYAVNDAKLQGIVSHQGAFKIRLFLYAKHTGACLVVRVTTITSTLFISTEFRDVHVLVTTLNPLTSKTNVTVACKPFRCVTCSSILMEVLSLHVTIRYVTISSNSQNKPSPLPAYADNPWSTWDAAYQRRRCVTKVVSKKYGITCQSGAYGRSRKKQLLTSGLDMLMQRLGNQW